jgi:hypothetical protein
MRGSLLAIEGFLEYSDLWDEWGGDVRETQKQIPPLRCGMTTRRTGNSKGKMRQKQRQKQIPCGDDKQKRQLPRQSQRQKRRRYRSQEGGPPKPFNGGESYWRVSLPDWAVPVKV